MIVQADFLGENVALAHRIHPVDEVHDAIGDGRVGIRAEILRVLVFGRFPDDFDDGIGFVGDFDVGIGLIVHEHDVEARTVFLDQVDFKQKRFFFRGRDEIIEVVDLTHQFGGLVVVGSDEIGIDPVFEFLGLPDIDDRPGLVFHQITTGFGR